MAIVRITKEFKFEMAHALYGHDGPCRHVHGHSYELFVTIKGVPVIDPQSPKNGMVMDFTDLKKIVHKNIVTVYDHALVLGNNVPSSEIPQREGLFERLIIVDFQPSSENLLIHFSRILMPLLPEGIQLYSMKLRETVTSYAEWFADDNA
ncbi:MAG: 6-carboxytetrahydropterin synthase [Bacteroidales bacterium]|nr:6-carboxytetrahydropterin synthase [Bacteroidales bacterium]